VKAIVECETNVQGITHAILGAGAGVVLGAMTHADPARTLLMVAAGTVGGLLPDIDTPHSIIRDVLPPLHWLLFWLKHRGPTHSLLLLALVTVVGLRFVGIYGLPLGAGYATHLVADMLTHEGVPLLFPYPGFFHILPRPLRLKTGGRVEKVFRVFATMAVALGGMVDVHLVSLGPLLRQIDSFLKRVLAGAFP
jgi:inner membrane protein